MIQKTPFLPAALILLCCGEVAATAEQPDHTLVLANSHFRLEISTIDAGVMALRRPGDALDTNYVIGRAEHPELAIDDSRWFGDLVLRYRVGSGEWRSVTTGRSDDTRQIVRSADGMGVTVEYVRDSTRAGGIRDVAVSETYRLDGERLRWTLEFRNKTGDSIELGDIGLPLPFNSYYVRDTAINYRHRVVRHSYIAGDNSFIFWMRANAVGPYLVMTPARGARLEYFDRTTQGDTSFADSTVFGAAPGWEGLYTAYIHAAVQGHEVERRGSWNQPLTTRLLAPRGEAGDRASYTFDFHWATDYAAVRNIRVNAGLIDVEALPGMVIPTNLAATVSLRAAGEIEEVVAQYPEHTKVERLPSPAAGRELWRFDFSRLGENNVRIRWDEGRETSLEFFVTEPLRTLINKRAAFIVEHQQVRDSSVWYDGLFSVWDMVDGKLLTPDDPGGLHPYMVGGSDDPTMCKASYVASKNVHYPDPRQIEALEYHLEHFVWGKLQRTDQEEPFPFGVYGVINWKENRESDIGFNSGGHGREHLWRTYDYPHLIQLYFLMYRIAKMYPEMVRYLDADGYLDRAYGTARAFFVVPYDIYMGEEWGLHGWTDWAYKTGHLHDLYIVDLIDALEGEGRSDEAAWLRGEWEKKLKYFVYDDPYPFASEMYFDTTAFQTTHALARYALHNPIRPDARLWRDKNTGQWYSHPDIERADFTRFMDQSLEANIAARGWLETNYYQLGSDIRGGGNSTYLLSYMTQMGGGSILDYALNYADEQERFPLLRLGYASYLGPWSLVNSGSRASDYGYWFDGAQNDGAASWAFKPEKVGPIWAGGEQERGGWRYDGEVDNGLSDALLSAATIVVLDPLFGVTAYGGFVTMRENELLVNLRDGLQQKLFLRDQSEPLDLILNRDGFDANYPVSIRRDRTALSFRLENRYAVPHETVLLIRGMKPGGYQLVTGSHTARITVPANKVARIVLDVHSDRTLDVRLERLDRQTTP